MGVHAAGALVERAIQLGIIAIDSPSTRNLLSPRQIRIVRRLRLGWSAQEIAEELKVTRSCIKGQYRTIKATLRVRTLDEAVDQAEKMGLLDRQSIPLAALTELGSGTGRAKLTAREEEVRELVARGIDSRALIAQRLGISESTAAAHLSRIRRKMGQWLHRRQLPARPDRRDENSALDLIRANLNGNESATARSLKITRDTLRYWRRAGVPLNRVDDVKRVARTPPKPRS